MLDVDGAEGFESLAAMEAEHGILDPRARQRSGSGGWHYLFEAVRAEKHMKFRPGLDLLTGPGCYIVTRTSPYTPRVASTVDRCAQPAVRAPGQHRAGRSPAVAVGRGHGSRKPARLLTACLLTA